MTMKKRLEIDSGILHEIVQRLTDASGIDAESLDSARIRWTVEMRCRHVHLSSAEAYLAHLKTSQHELDELIDALVIQETRFFRDTAVFEHIRQWASAAYSAGMGPLRVLSAPCSTGQEAYSVAAVLRLAGIPLGGFAIDAVDISRAALATAARGVYAAGALQNFPAEFQAACGTLRNQHWHIHEALRSRIRFSRRNLAVEGALEEDGGYHLILCRNLFIYLNAGSRSALAEGLSKALLPGGRLIVGAGDRVAELNARFVHVKPAAGFSFTHRTAMPARVPKARMKEQAERVVPARANATTPQVTVTNLQKPEPALPATEFLRRAVEYMERGNLRQAERRCRQALYLAPGYLPALELLEMLWQMHPNARLRRALSARIVRVRAEADAIVGRASLAGEVRS